MWSELERWNWTSGERHTGTSRGHLRWQTLLSWVPQMVTGMLWGQITYGCRNPLPSLASRDGNQEGEIRARGEISLKSCSQEGAQDLRRRQLSGKSSPATQHPPNTRSGPGRGRQANLGSSSGSSSSGIVMHESPAPPPVGSAQPEPPR